MYMNEVIIECTNLLDKYELNKETIIQQLQNLNLNEPQYFVITYAQDFRFTLLGKINNDKIILQFIEKAIDYRKMDNTDLLSFINNNSQ